MENKMVRKSKERKAINTIRNKINLLEDTVNYTGNNKEAINRIILDIRSYLTQLEEDIDMED